MNSKIDELRKKIDKIDDNLISLISQRKHISSELIKIKLDACKPVFDSKRENEIIEKHIVSATNALQTKERKDAISPTLIKKIFQLILDDSKREHYKNEKLLTIEENIQRKPLFIAGPCVVESAEQINNIANEISELGVKFLRGGTFKSRTSPTTFQGLEDKGIQLLHYAAKSNNMYTVTEILEAEQYERNQEFIDIVQIGSRSMTSYGLLKSIGKLTADSNKFILLKRGFSATINEFLMAADYILQAGNANVILCLRGIRTFEQIDSTMRFTPDLADILSLKEKTNLPIIFDPSHSTGNSRYIVPISNAALQLGADGLIIETHNEPCQSFVDSMQAITPKELLKIINL